MENNIIEQPNPDEPELKRVLTQKSLPKKQNLRRLGPIVKRKTFLPFALPDIDDAEITQVTETLKSGWITTGPKTREFETKFSQMVGAPTAVALNSCTAAMHLALEAIGLQSGDLVLTTPYTFAATAEVIRYFNAVPIFVDVEPNTLNINPNLLAQAATDLTCGNSAARQWLPRNVSGRGQRVAAILPVHIGGLPAGLDEIYKIANDKNLAVIEDAAHAFPAKYKNRFIGSTNNTNIRSAVCFSFYATKTITTGEGGMLTTANKSIAERCRTMALHGMNHDAWKRYTNEGDWYYEIIAPGYKYNLTDIAAALGLAQLTKAEQMQQRRRQIAEHYNHAFGPMPELQIPANRADCQHAWHLYMARLNLDRLTISRSQFIEALKARNIGASVHFIPLHLHPYYRETYGYQPEDFPAAYGEYQREVSLPIYSKMTDADVQDVIGAVKDIIIRNQV